MKYSPTVTLTVLLAAGMAGAAVAQTAAAPSTMTTPQSAAPASAPAQTAATPSTTTPPQSAAPAPAQANSARETAAGASEQVRMAQQRLQSLGLYSGPSDGVMDPDTRMAIARFQDQHGLRRSENLDRQTLAQLSSPSSGFGSSTPSTSPAPATGQQGAAPAEAGGNTGGQAPQR